MDTPREGEVLKFLRDGRLFKVKRVADEFVLLSSVDGSSQIMAGKKEKPPLFIKRATV